MGKKTTLLILALFFNIQYMYSQISNSDLYYIEAKIDIDSINVIDKYGPNFTNIVTLNNIFVLSNVYEFKEVYKNFKNPNLKNNFFIKIPKCQDIDSLIYSLESLNYISNIYVDTFIHNLLACEEPLSVTDPFNHCESGLYDVDPKYYLTMTGAECAWEINSGNPNLLIAVIDTEFDINHEELYGKIESIKNYSPVTSLTEFHGTGTAGLIVANHNNGFGSAGIGKNLRVRGYMPSS